MKLYESGFWFNASVNRPTFGRDKSGSINLAELETALSNFGYSLTKDVLGILINKFDRSNQQAVNFDDFIQCCLVLQVCCRIEYLGDIRRFFTLVAKAKTMNVQQILIWTTLG